jgi:hypothetical protein
VNHGGACHCTSTHLQAPPVGVCASQVIFWSGSGGQPNLASWDLWHGVFIHGGPHATWQWLQNWWVAYSLQNVCLAVFEVSTAVLLRFQILWDLHGSRSERIIFLNLMTLKMKATCSFWVSVNTNTVALSVNTNAVALSVNTNAVALCQ